MTDIERQVLAFEKRRWNRRGHKEQAIRDELGVSPVRYYQVLARLLDSQSALAAEPQLVNRLRRIARR